MTKEDIKDAEKFYNDRRNREEITICMATHPPKKMLWKNAYADLREQCDRFILVLGGEYCNHIPEGFLDDNHKRDIESGKLKVVVAGKDGLPEDKGCQNKFMFYGDFPGYYCTMDDDIRYSKNCVYQLIKKYEEYRRKAIVSFFGRRFSIKDGKVLPRLDKKECFYHDKCHRDQFCHKIGCGCAMFRPVDFTLTKEEFLSKSKNEGDDEILALWAQINGVPLMAVDNTHCLISRQPHDKKTGLNYSHRLTHHRFKMWSLWTSWRLVTL